MNIYSIFACSLSALALVLCACTNESVSPNAPQSGGAERAADAPMGQDAPSGKRGPRAAPGELVRTIWYDGDEQRTAWLDPALIADHAPSPESRDALAKLAPDAQELSTSGAPVRIWRLGPSSIEGPASIGAVELCSALRSASAAGRFSPVFHTNASQESPHMSLPGGSVVAFGADWTNAAAEGWLAERGLVIERRLELGTPAFVVASAPGLPALELANELRTAPEVRWATPDWWMQPEKR